MHWEHKSKYLICYSKCIAKQNGLKVKLKVFIATLIIKIIVTDGKMLSKPLQTIREATFLSLLVIKGLAKVFHPWKLFYIF